MMQISSSRRVRTTVDLHETLLQRAKALAAERGQKLGDVVNEALAEMLSRREQAEGEHPKPVVLPVYGGSGVRPGVDLRSNASMLEALDRTGSE